MFLFLQKSVKFTLGIKKIHTLKSNRIFIQTNAGGENNKGIMTMMIFINYQNIISQTSQNETFKICNECANNLLGFIDKLM